MMWCVFTVYTDTTITQHTGIYRLFAVVPDCIILLVSHLQGIFLCVFQLVKWWVAAHPLSIIDAPFVQDEIQNFIW